MIMQYFSKKGGINLIKKYIYNHVFIYACFLFLFLPKNRKGLEILDSCITLKIFLRTKKKNQKNTKIFPSPEFYIKPKIIWFCWLQGLENAPVLVHVVLESIKKSLSDYTIKIITAENFGAYTDIPDFIIKKWKIGIISNTHFSDILRTNILINNGGTWIDSTALITSKIPEDIEKSSIFFFRTFKPGDAGHAINSSNWFISSCKSNPILLTIQNYLYNFWKKNNHINDYFFYHMFTEMAFEQYPDLVDFMPKYSNDAPHFLFYLLNVQFNKDIYEMVKQQSFIHKLSNKFVEEKNDKKTFYSYIINERG